MYDSRVVEVAKNVRPSERGEMEIIDLHNWYLEKGELTADIIEGEWLDAGTFESLFKAGEFVRNKTVNRLSSPKIIQHLPAGLNPAGRCWIKL